MGREEDPFAGAPLQAGMRSSWGDGAPAAAAPSAAAPQPARELGPTAAFGYERQPGAGTGGRPRYRVFEYLDGEKEGGGGPAGPLGTASDVAAGEAAAGRAGPRPSSGDSGGGGLGVLDASHHERPLDSVADVGQKAARMLQSGTKWFMKASKNLVKQVQTNLVHPGGGGLGEPARGGKGMRLAWGLRRGGMHNVV